ncbi:hypothetical protein DPEC_G00088960 [Dallia pectoralis]|uniref:Uncharacterized protein n=1 Tax=Dallia pectoralis TaxID=75939 RepID=A0ACC2H106_DALPE|nr:hypothetical protein DPEC_G00088960 [Dallia pectoralis]
MLNVTFFTVNCQRETLISYSPTLHAPALPDSPVLTSPAAQQQILTNHGQQSVTLLTAGQQRMQSFCPPPHSTSRITQHQSFGTLANVIPLDIANTVYDC